MKASPLTAYTVSPIVFLYGIIHALGSGKLVFFLITMGGLILLMGGVFFICKTWEIPHPLPYALWVTYLAICIIGISMT
jgi:hypothetical protein